jgi:hypothetical protein
MKSTSDSLSGVAAQKWQEKLLPLMSRMVIGLTLFFFVASFGQLLYLQAEISRDRPFTLSETALGPVAPGNASISEQLNVARLRAAAELELQVVTRRYRQATVLLMSRVWTLYLGFVTGMILALVGAAFILGKLQEASSDLSVKSAGNELTLKTASPGIILAALGTVLMLATIVTNHRIEVIDTPLYLRESIAPVQVPSKDPVPTLENPYSRPERK